MKDTIEEQRKAQIREVLLQHWDPIGVGDIPEAQDEYDSYIPQIYDLVFSQNGSLQELTHFLLNIVRHYMGLKGCELENEKTAKFLIDLRSH